VSSYEGYDGPRYAYPRRSAERSHRTEEPRAAPVENRTSHAAIPLAVALMVVGLVLGKYTVLIPGILGLILLSTAWSFLSTHLNPFSVGYYLTVKPSWSSIAVLGMLGLLLLFIAYTDWRSGYAPILPGFVHLP
jgi:hypothetical protein